MAVSCTVFAINRDIGRENAYFAHPRCIYFRLNTTLLEHALGCHAQIYPRVTSATSTLLVLRKLIYFGKASFSAQFYIKSAVLNGFVQQL